MEKRKRGGLTKVEQQFIRDNIANLSPDEIASQLNRDVKVIYNFIQYNVHDPVSQAKKAAEDARVSGISEDIRQSMKWKMLADEFTDREMIMFEEEYVRYSKQFKDDITAADEVILFKLIKFQILMSRNLKQQKRVRGDIERYELERDKILGGYKNLREMDDDDKARVAQLDDIIGNLVKNEIQLTSQHDKLDSSHQEILKSLKATREQRISKIENSKRNFLDIIRMLQEQDAQERADRQIDHLKKASEKELLRLGAAYEYDDGIKDRPILSAETVMFEDQP